MVEFLTTHWAEIGVVYLLVLNFVKGLRDAWDKTPETDDNLFEKFVTVMGKVGAYLTIGKRA